MTLTTTAGDAAADSYFSLTEATAYFTARGITAWTGTDTVKEQAARKATAYLDNVYRDRWVGLKSTSTQSLAWPRVDGVRDPYRRSLTFSLVDIDGFEIPSDTVPAQIKTAAMEAALLAIGGTTLEPTLERGGQVKSLSETIGPISTETVWTDGAPTVDRYMAIEGLLRGLVTSSPGASSGNIKLVRA